MGSIQSAQRRSSAALSKVLPAPTRGTPSVEHPVKSDLAAPKSSQQPQFGTRPQSAQMS